MALVAVNRGVIPNPGRWQQRGFGDLPPNIQAGECIPWQDNAGMQVDPDGYIWINGSPTGKKQCQAYAQLDIRPTVLSVPSDVMDTFNEVRGRSELLRQNEQALQELCRRAQAYTDPDGRPMAGLASLWQQAQGILASAQDNLARADAAWSQAKQIDDSVGGAYFNGEYSDPNVYAQVVATLQAYNHAPLAWADCHAAAECVRDALRFWEGVCLGDFRDRFAVVETNANRVSDIYNEVQDFVARLSADAERVKLSKDAADAIAGAKPALDQLVALANQIGPLWQQAQMSSQAAEAGFVNDSNPQAIEDAFYWMKDVQPVFLGAGDHAAALSSDIHGRLDHVAADLREYIAQHPELPGNKTPLSSGAKGALWLSAGAVAIVLAKKAALFG